MKKIFVIFFCLVLAISLIACSNNHTAEEVVTSMQVKESEAESESFSPAPAYTLVMSEDVSTEDTPRFSYWVAVNTEITADEAKAIAHDVIENQPQKGGDTVFIYDSEEGARSGLISSKICEVPVVYGKVHLPVINDMYGK